jgi:hydroxyacylglutathione hydrolase
VSELEIVVIPNGQLAENCYLLADTDSNQAVIIDPGEESDRFLAEVKRRDWDLQAIWFTHGHVDHIMGVDAVHRATGAPIHLHPLDRPLYDALPEYSSWVGMQLEQPPEPQVELQAGQVLELGSYRFAVRLTPGHSPGSVSFLGHGVIFGGDVLFNGSVGRTDLPGGDTAILISTIQDQFLTLPDSTVVHSGHGPDTTIGVERVTNPFLTGAYRVG